jgi:hypothetical protein
MDVYVGEDASLEFEFKVDGEFVSPDTASFTVRDNAGAAIPSLTNVPIALVDAETEAVVDVPLANNTVAGGKVFEARTVEVKFTYQGDTFRLRQSYRVLPWLNYTGTAADVRRELGVLDHEISDSDVDLVAAYIQVRNRVTDAVLVAALSAGDLTTIAANQAVVCKAALNLIPALQLRAAQMQGDDNQKFQRVAKLDFDKLEDQLTDRYEYGIEGVNPNALPTTQQYLSAATPVDAITGT